MRLIDADALMAQFDVWDVNDEVWVESIRAEIANAPTIEPEDKCGECDAWNQYKNYPRKSQWIPCSKKMPEDLEEVNVTWVNHSPEPYYNFVKDKPFTATAVYYKEKWYWYSSVCADILAESGTNYTDEIDSAIEITAWMPLPESYLGETESRYYENKGDDD